MSREKMIEETAKIIARRSADFRNPNVAFMTTAKKTAESLCNAGYRKQSEEGAECPTCYGTGRIGTTNWLTKNMTQKQIAEEKAKAIAEHELHIKQDYAREIFGKIEQQLRGLFDFFRQDDCIRESSAIVLAISEIAELKKKYTEKGEGSA